MTLKEKVLKLLGERGPITLKELHDLLPEHTYHGMCGTVYRYVYQGVVVRVGKGKYALAKEDNKRTGRKAKSGGPAKSTKNPRSIRRTKGKPQAPKAMSAEAALADALCRFADGFGLALTASGGETYQSHRKSHRRIKIPSYEAMKKRLIENGMYDSQVIFSDGSHLKNIEAMTDAGHSAMLLKFRIPNLEYNMYRLPDHLIENGRKAYCAFPLLRENNAAFVLRFVFDILRWAGIKNTKEVREAIRFTATPNSRYVYAFFEDSDFTIATKGLKREKCTCELIRV
jgi:hypothetical protein